MTATPNTTDLLPSSQELPPVDNTSPLTLDVGALGYTFHATDRAAEDYANATDQLLIRESSDLLILSGPQLIAFFNVLKGPSVPEVKKFADKATAVKRTWAAIQARAEAWEAAQRELAERQPQPEPQPEPEGQSSAKPEAAPAKEPKAPRSTKLKDKSIGPAPKTHPFRAGSVGEAILALVSREGGIHVDDFIREMNAVSVNWTRSNAWGSARYFLFDKKGYGLQMVNEVLSLKTK